MKKHIAILGSTGSIGTQTLDIIRSYPDKFSAEVLTANSNAELLAEQALEFLPDSVVIADERRYGWLKETLQNHPDGRNIKIFAGSKAIEQIVESDKLDMIVTALVGASGLKPTVSAIRAGRNIALANKETLVVAGGIVTELAREKGVNLYPVDSEHSAIFQCMAGEWQNRIEKIYLTASGGPFRGRSRSELENVTVEEALAHPNWTMGRKITVDSATMMNKGLEMIEAKWLFGLKPEQIDVIVHPQSIIHSIVQFTDGSMKSQMGLPDMKLPIIYALSYPERLLNEFKRFSFLDYPELTFHRPDTDTFSSLSMASEAMQAGGNMPCIMNAANEIAVQAFLDSRIGFLQIPEIIQETMKKIPVVPSPGLEDLIESDKEARAVAAEFAGVKVA